MEIIYYIDLDHTFVSSSIFYAHLSVDTGWDSKKYCYLDIPLEYKKSVRLSYLFEESYIDIVKTFGEIRNYYDFICSPDSNFDP